MPATNREISATELSKHTKADDLWVSFKGNVYDISAFVNEHPGGEEVLLDVAGRDCTEEFEDVGHSADAVKILDQYYVGVDENSKASAPEESAKSSCSCCVGKCNVSLIIAAAAVVVGALIYRYKK